MNGSSISERRLRWPSTETAPELNPFLSPDTLVPTYSVKPIAYYMMMMTTMPLPLLDRDEKWNEVISRLEGALSETDDYVRARGAARKRYRLSAYWQLRG